MSPRLRALAPLFLAAGLVSAPLAAAQWRVVIDPEASEIGFTLGATLHSVHGTIDVLGGEIVFDDETGEASGEIVADATSADTGNAKRDRDMHRKVLESEEYPRIVFRVREVAGQMAALAAGGPAEVDVAGEIEIHGDSHPVTLPARVEPGDGAMTATAELVVPYVEWGMEDPSKFILRVEKHVDVEIRAVGELHPPEVGEGDPEGEGEPEKGDDPPPDTPG